MLLLAIFFALPAQAEICGVTHTVEPVKESLPPESELIRPINGGAVQLRYKGATPVVFFRKGSVPLDVNARLQLTALGLPTGRGETPVAKLESDRQYTFSFGSLDEQGRMQVKGWELENKISAYPISAATTPELKPEIARQLREGKLDSREETAALPYYYGRELRKIDLKYTFKRVPGFDPARCL